MCWKQLEAPGSRMTASLMESLAKPWGREFFSGGRTWRGSFCPLSIERELVKPFYSDLRAVQVKHAIAVLVLATFIPLKPYSSSQASLLPDPMKDSSNTFSSPCLPVLGEVKRILTVACGFLSVPAFLFGSLNPVLTSYINPSVNSIRHFEVNLLFSEVILINVDMIRGHQNRSYLYKKSLEIH